jgi:hypothetical protein
MSHFLARRWAFISKRPEEQRRANRRGNKPRVRPKHADRKLPALDVLEFRETISDTLFAGAQVASVLASVPMAAAAADVLAPSRLSDLSVSGGSTDTPESVARSGSGRLEPDVSVSSSSVAAGDVSSTSQESEPVNQTKTFRGFAGTAGDDEVLQSFSVGLAPNPRVVTA